MAGVSTEYINNAIDELVNLVGIKESIASETALEPLRSRQLLECVQVIANHLDLPCAFSVSISDKFESKALVPSSCSKQGTAGITAQVNIPSNLPLYGSSKLQGFPIRVTVNGDCTRNQETFVAILAHELSHVVLSSLWHKQKDNEFYTDLTAMILGFSDVMRRGRKTVETKQTTSSTTTTTTTTYGYLSDTLFDFAYGKIQQKLIEERKLNLELREGGLRKMTVCKDQIALCKEQLLLINELTCRLDKNPNKRIKKQDIPKIMQIHQLNYADRLEVSRKSNEHKLKEIAEASEKSFRPTQHYTKQEKDSLQAMLQTLNNLSSDLSKDLEMAGSDIEVLKRYSGFFNRFKIKSPFNNS